MKIIEKIWVAILWLFALSFILGPHVIHLIHPYWEKDYDHISEIPAIMWMEWSLVLGISWLIIGLAYKTLKKTD